jgi:hypothetical protein
MKPSASRVADRHLEAAAPIDIDMLPDEQMKIVDMLKKHGLKPVTAYAGAGFIVEFAGDENTKVPQITVKRISVRKVFRWLAPRSGGGFVVGM